MNDEKLKKLITRRFESKILKDFYSDLNDDDLKKLVIQNKKYNLHKEPTNIIDGELENIRNLTSGLLNKYKNLVFDLLANNGLQGEQSDKVINEMVEIETQFNLALDIPLNLIKSAADYSYKSSEVMPSVERHLKGKAPKAESPDKIKAKEWAKDIWAKSSIISVENMALQLKENLELNQSIDTIKRWIKPLKPKTK